MKDFLHNYSYSSVKMFVNQFAISIFGAMLSMASSAAENDTLAFWCSILAIVFYLFLIYTQAWELGAKDKISVDIGKKEYKPHRGLGISALANIPNYKKEEIGARHQAHVNAILEAEAHAEHVADALVAVEEVKENDGEEA